MIIILKDGKRCNIRRNMFDNKFVKVKICCQCNNLNEIDSNKCSMCGLLLVDEISNEEYQRHINKLKEAKKDVD